MSIYKILGIEPDADERAIKRAYAQRMRSCRPDEDPEGFQRLNQAYKQALKASARQPSGAAGATSPPPTQLSVDLATSEHASNPPSHLSERPRHKPRSSTRTPKSTLLSPAKLLPLVLDVAAEGNADGLLAWLKQREELWSIEAKAQVGKLLMKQFNKSPPMPSSCFETLLAFFDLDLIRGFDNPYVIDDQRTRGIMAWELLPAQSRELARHTRIFGKRQPEPKLAQRIVQRLSGSFRFWPMLWLLVPRGRPDHITNFLRTFSRGRLSLLLNFFDEKSLKFLFDADDHSRMAQPRFILGTARVLLALLFVVVVSGGFVLVVNQLNTENPLEWSGYGGWVLLCVMAASLWLPYAGAMALQHWQAAPQKARDSPARWAFIPLLCCLSYLTLLLLGDNPVPVASVAIAALWLAFHRLHRRHPAGKPVSGIRPYVYVFILELPVSQFSAIGWGEWWALTAVNLVTMGYWTTDLIKTLRQKRRARTR
ncbi:MULTISPECIES: J domain-containing protein [Dyella]|uniref:J domain-containing protein n=2 Tax=Dyella TaxID=231454 RepID=A0A4R0YZ49_9GAMM|nr:MULTISPECIES: J domain-containing protein [Dyella]TBR39816.1 hypothetical protein EYV96_06435 [Dyella terrae]TCI12604.1 hypothetical protein EZM97_04435 [Dyella soli]